MGAFSIIAVRGDERVVEAAFAAASPGVAARLACSGPWVSLVGVDVGQVPLVAAAVSARLGADVVACAGHSAVDLVEIWVFRRGEIERRLAGSGDTGWTQVEGQRQPWEAAVFGDGDRRAWPRPGAWCVDAIAVALALPGPLAPTRRVGPRGVGPLAVVAVFMVALVADYLWLPRANLWSTAVVFAQMGAFLWALQRRSGG